MKNQTPHQSNPLTTERMSEQHQERDVSHYKAGYRQAKRDQAEKDNQRVAGLMIGSIIAVAMGLGAFTWYLFGERNQRLQPIFVPQEESTDDTSETQSAPPNINVTVESPNSESPATSDSPSETSTEPNAEPSVSNNAPAVNTEVNVEAPSPNPISSPANSTQNSPTQNGPSSSNNSSVPTSGSAESQSPSANAPVSQESPAPAQP